MQDPENRERAQRVLYLVQHSGAGLPLVMLAEGSRDWPMTERNGREEMLSGGIAAENGSPAVMQRAAARRAGRFERPRRRLRAGALVPHGCHAW